MGLTRMCTMLRYKSVCRMGAMTYVLFVLALLAGWTSIHNLTSREMVKVRRNGADSSHHVHVRNEDILHNYDDILVVKSQRNKNVEPPVYEHKAYPSNHSHPVKAMPRVADPQLVVAAQGRSSSCSVVRQVEFFGQRLTLDGDPLCAWLAKPVFLADDHFVLYDNMMALLYDVTVDPACLEAGAKGGEKMEEVWGQSEEAEYLKLKEGFFTLKCVTKPAAEFGPKDHLSHWISAVRCAMNDTKTLTTNRVGGLTIAIQRYEYVNLYHTMTDFYNAFLAMLMFNQHPDDVTILWVDAHPQGGLDSTWETLFGKVVRAGVLSSPTRFSALAWAAMGYNSPLNHHSRPSVHYLEEFRHFFLSRHGLDGARKANCSSLNWLFIWRRDYAAHPRNKGGRISRKIDNEDELLAAVRGAAGPADQVLGVQLDALPMQAQLHHIARTDVLLGMHGAGLSHTLFLPPHGGLLEFYPTYWPQANRHFRAMATWRGLHYQTWQNTNNNNEKPNQRTYIPPQVAVKMVKEMRKSICGR
ncbi:uncharacterized protein LOC143284473 [Babylonia areolata]|uniref:uncharacterized protein LOC143284473 n=1 Tax=Babylonia areolata TaxID=304850 RepID=UPI003FD57716